MANAHPKEQELYDRIQNENVKVPFHIWDILYHYIGDAVTAITQITLSYSKYNESIEIEDAKKIMEHTRKINTIVDKILHPEKITDNEEISELASLKQDPVSLHPLINELFTHYISNDVYGINMIVGFHLDPLDESPIPVDNAQKILDKTYTMKKFMDRLSAATNQEISLTIKNVLEGN